VSEALLTARDVHVRFGAREAVRGVDLAMGRGELVSLLGPNGSGKSTLLKALAGVIRPSAGDVTRGMRVAYLAQDEPLPDDFTALDVARLGRLPALGLFGVETRSDLRAANEALERTGVADLAARRVGELSGGERRRVALARALAQGADVLLLDEPLAHLDPRHQSGVLDVLREEATSKRAVLLVLHDVLLAAGCTRCVLLREGRVVVDGPPTQALEAAALRATFDADFELATTDDGARVPILRSRRRRP